MAAVMTMPKKQMYVMIAFSAYGELSSTLPPVPKSTLASAKAPPDISTNKQASPKNTPK